MLNQPTQPRDDDCIGMDSVEGAAFSIEDTGVDTNTKIDDLIAIAAEVKRALNRRLIIVTAAIMVPLIIGVMFLIAVHAQANDIKRIATTTQSIAASTNNNSRNIQAVLDGVNNATGPEARAKSTATLKAALDDIRRSLDCQGFYFHDPDRKAVCDEVSARLDAIDAGQDPFAS